MSVINKMLRDLDRRQGAGAQGKTEPTPQHEFAHNTLVVPAPDDVVQGLKGQAGRRWLLLVLLVLVAGLWWWLRLAALTPSAAGVASPARVADLVVDGPAALGQAHPASAALRSTEQLRVPALKAVTAPESRPGQRLLEVPLKMDFSLKSAPARHPAAAPVAREATSTAPKAAPEGVRPQVPTPAVAASSAMLAPMPAMQVLAQAQSLWNAGSHEAAVDLLRDALGHVERLGAGANAMMLAPLARELARMELAQGRPRQALDMLQRLEPVLSGVAEVWALRGNVAQRLGRHQESASAYLAALALHPQEPRWMLGAAVSLAANGQLEAAADWAEKARAQGALSAELAAYLRQSGVILQER